MKKLKIKCERKGKLKSQRCLLLLLVLAVFVVLWASATQPACADEVNPIEDPGGGGGGGYRTPPQNCDMIEGCVTSADPYVQPQGIPGVRVYLYVGWEEFTTKTDANGHFKFESPTGYGGWIDPDYQYCLTVNGINYYLGVNCINPRWGQWRGFVKTNEWSYGFKHIVMEPSAVVKVPVAALFSNTKYATLYYGREAISSFSHITTFKVAGTGISTGYMTSTSASMEFGAAPLVSFYVGKPHYAATYWDDAETTVGVKHGVVSSGIAAEVEMTDWSTYLTREYKDPNSLKEDYLDFEVASGTYKRAEYKETGSHTWSESLGADFSIKYGAYGIPIDIGTTVTGTTGTTNWVSYLVDRRGDENLDPLIFRVYTPGGFRDIDHPDPEKHYGGLELHIWDMGGAG